MPRRPLTPEREAELLARYATDTNQELAAAFGLRVTQVVALGQKHGLRKSHDTLSRARLAREAANANGGAMAEQVFALAQAAGEAGVSHASVCAALPGLNPDSLTAALYKLTAMGRVHRGGKKGSARWYINAADAAAFDQQQRTPPAPKAAKPCAPALVANGVQITHQPGPALTPGEAYTPDHITPIKCPSVPGPEARWHTNAAPILKAMGPGRYTDEPSSWVKALTERATA